MMLPNDRPLFNKQTLADLAASWTEERPRRVIQGEPHTVQLWPLPGVSEVVKQCDLEGESQIVPTYPVEDFLAPLLPPEAAHQASQALAEYTRAQIGVAKLCDLEGMDSLPPNCFLPSEGPGHFLPADELGGWHITSVEGPDEAPLTLSSRLEDIAAQLRLEIMGPDHLPEILKALGHLEVAMLLLRNVGK